MLDKETIARYLLKEETELTAYTSFITRDFQAAEDIFQDVCVKALMRAETFKDTEHLRRWSLVVSRNQAINWVCRYKKRQIQLSDKLLEILEDEWPNHEMREYSLPLDALNRCIQRLTPRSQEIVRLRYFKGLSGIDVAKTLQRKVRTIYQALARIHKQLQQCMTKQLSKEY